MLNRVVVTKLDGVAAVDHDPYSGGISGGIGRLMATTGS
jgi:hypothetical protein